MSASSVRRRAKKRPDRFPNAQHEQNRSKNAPHAGCRKVLRETASEDAAEKHAGDDQQARAHIHVMRVIVGEKGEQTGGRNERDQAGSLRAMLLEMVQEDKQWNQQYAAAHSK